jgi:hypothetical protein
MTIDRGVAIPTDLRLLAEAVLNGDESAAMPLCDCLMENWKGKERITPEYVNVLEDVLHSIHVTLMTADHKAKDMMSVKIGQYDYNVFISNYWKLVSMGAALNRQGLR